jgi:hypothetical protein
LAASIKLYIFLEVMKDGKKNVRRLIDVEDSWTSGQGGEAKTKGISNEAQQVPIPAN